MNTAERLKAQDITPTIDACRAYRLGREQAMPLTRWSLREAEKRIDKLERALTEIALQAQRVIR